MADETISDAIKANAAGPKKVAGDAGTVEQHSLSDQIAADKHVSQVDAVKKRSRGLRFTKLLSPGAV